MDSKVVKWVTRPSRKNDIETAKNNAALDWVDYNILKWQSDKPTPKDAAKILELENRLSKTSYKNHLQTEKKPSPSETKKNLNKYNATQLFNDWASKPVKPVKKVKVSYKKPDPITDYDWRIAPWYDLTDESFEPVPKPKPETKRKELHGLDYLLGGVDKKF
tara:strand:- start:85 stop:570 length:486 start_codon:yes stop_codon:yes gene_type:complete